MDAHTKNVRVAMVAYNAILKKHMISRKGLRVWKHSCITAPRKHKRVTTPTTNQEKSIWTSSGSLDTVMPFKTSSRESEKKVD